MRPHGERVVANCVAGSQVRRVASEDQLVHPKSNRLWTRTEDYVFALLRRRTVRREWELKPRTQPEAPRPLLSTLPFLVLIAALGVLGIAIMIADHPGSQPQPRLAVEQPELGVAAKGWFQEAQKDFHKST